MEAISGDIAPHKQSENRAADAVVACLMDDITSGKFPDGTPLPPERDLIARFGISRTVIREAIATLAMRGFLVSKPRHRPIVQLPGYGSAISALSNIIPHLLKQSEGIKTLYDVRIFLEVTLVRHAALHARKEHIAAMRKALERNYEAADDAVRFDQTDVEFHAVLYAIPDNPVFPAIHNAFVTWLFSYWQSMKRSREQNLRYYAGHVAILDGITDRDPDKAELALRDHLTEAWNTVRKTFEAQ